jgi:hypothetical protein
MRYAGFSLAVLALSAGLHENDAFFLGKRAQRQQQQQEDDDSKCKTRPHHSRNRWFKWPRLLNAQHERLFVGAALLVQHHNGVRGMLAAARTAAVSYGECYNYTGCTWSVQTADDLPRFIAAFVLTSSSP